MSWPLTELSVNRCSFTQRMPAKTCRPWWEQARAMPVCTPLSPSPTPALRRFSTNTSEVKNWSQFFCVVFSLAWVKKTNKPWNHIILIMGQGLEAIFTLEKSAYIRQGKNHDWFLALFEIYWITTWFPILSDDSGPVLHSFPSELHLQKKLPIISLHHVRDSGSNIPLQPPTVFFRWEQPLKWEWLKWLIFFLPKAFKGAVFFLFLSPWRPCGKSPSLNDGRNASSETATP